MLQYSQHRRCTSTHIWITVAHVFSQVCIQRSCVNVLHLEPSVVNRRRDVLYTHVHKPYNKETTLRYKECPDTLFASILSHMHSCILTKIPLFLCTSCTKYIFKSKLLLRGYIPKAVRHNYCQFMMVHYNSHCI
jgi:hypothetical protein